MIDPAAEVKAVETALAVHAEASLDRPPNGAGPRGRMGCDPAAAVDPAAVDGALHAECDGRRLVEAERHGRPAPPAPDDAVTRSCGLERRRREPQRKQQWWRESDDAHGRAGRLRAAVSVARSNDAGEGVADVGDARPVGHTRGAIGAVAQPLVVE